MIELKKDYITEKENWKNAGVVLPAFDIRQIQKNTEKAPRWIHFGAGNIFRGFIAVLQQELLEKGLADTGIIAAETFDGDIIEKIYKPHDNLTLLALMESDGHLRKQVAAGITHAVRAEQERARDYKMLETAFENPSLQMVSFTITEKGYTLCGADGKYLPIVSADIKNGPARCSHGMSVLVALLWKRWKAGAGAVALVSMDNCSRNGDILKSSVLEIAEAWCAEGHVEDAFVTYLKDEKCVSYPWSMIDKITPRPSQAIQKELEAAGIAGMDPIVTSRGTYIAPFVNAEVPQYLVVEDSFPNGRPPLEKAGVYFTDRHTVNQTETMKVTTCLNPLHTALAVYGCLLGYDSIAAEMKDPDLNRLVTRMGYEEGMPVVVNPGIIDPEAFIKEVLEQRLPNPYIPDMPQRIATDTSQKVGIRFGETIKAYQQDPNRDPSDLTFIPLALAGWFRYLLGVDDEGNAFERSADPLLPYLTEKLEGVQVGVPSSYTGQLREMMKNRSIFGIDLYEAGIAEKIEGLFQELIRESGAVRCTLQKYVNR